MGKTELRPRHLVLVRHGESEGDVRRATGRHFGKHPKDEGQTERGHDQSHAAGAWIGKNVLEAYNFVKFDVYMTSPLARTKQSAQSLQLSDNWIDEPRLAERSRGNIQGVTKQKHRELYPKSYQQMQAHPFHWTPPGGESLLRVSNRLTDFFDDLEEERYSTALLMTHRDVMWSVHIPLDRLNLVQIEQVDTNKISNGYIFHYTNINPINGVLDESFRWKRSIDPCADYPVHRLEYEWIDLDRPI